jgi:hypothetical protein
VRRLWLGAATLFCVSVAVLLFLCFHDCDVVPPIDLAPPINGHLPVKTLWIEGRGWSVIHPEGTVLPPTSEAIRRLLLRSKVDN